MFPKHVFETRRQKVVEMLDDNSILVLFSGIAPHKSADAEHHYHANRNFFYLTGVDRPNAALVVTKQGAKINTNLFIEFVDPTEEKWTGKRMSAQEATERSGIEAIQDIANLHTVFGRLNIGAPFESIYIDMEQHGFAHEPTVAHGFAKEVQARYPGLRIQNAYNQICQLRSVKDEHEVRAIREAIQVTKSGIENMWRHSKAGVNEYELEAHFDFALMSKGYKEHAFGTIIAGGARATVLHYEQNDQVIEDNQMALIDLGAAAHHYSADISRTFPVNGRFTDRQRELYEVVLIAMEETFAAIKPGMSYQELNDVTKATYARELKRIGLIQNDDEVSNYYYHSVSHPLGLDTHDVANHLGIQVGSVITVEPGLYVAEEGIGIRVEDDILVTEDGIDNLSKDIPKTVAEIEAFFRG